MVVAVVLRVMFQGRRGVVAVVMLVVDMVLMLVMLVVDMLVRVLVVVVELPVHRHSGSGGSQQRKDKTKLLVPSITG